jgi:hypothetical protein
LEVTLAETGLGITSIKVAFVTFKAYAIMSVVHESTDWFIGINSVVET